MGQPTPSDVHVDKPLTDMSVAFLQQNDAFIASKVFPNISVSKQTDKYYTWERNNFYSDQMEKRAPGTESAGGSIVVSTDSYSADVWALHKDIDDQVRANEDEAVSLDRAATEYLALQAAIRKDRQWNADYFGTGKWTTDVVAGTDFTAWDDASSNPEADVHTGKETVLKSTGYEPNTLVVSYPVHLALKRHPAIIDRIKYTGRDSISMNLIASYFEVDRYFVSKGVYNTSGEGDATPTFDFVTGQDALLCYSAPNPGIMVPSAGYTFSWTGLTAGVDGTRVSRMRMDHLRSDRIEIETAFDFKKVSADLGYFFSAATS